VSAMLGILDTAQAQVFALPVLSEASRPCRGTTLAHCVQQEPRETASRLVSTATSRASSVQQEAFGQAKNQGASRVSTIVFPPLGPLAIAAATQGFLPLDKRAMRVLLALTKTCLAFQSASRALELLTTLTQQLLCVLHVRPTLRAVLSIQKTAIVCVTEGLQDLLEARVCNVHWASSRL